MGRKALLITPDLCIGCRACQVACKSWNGLPAEKTKNNGTHENPPDLSGNTYNIVLLIFQDMINKERLVNVICV